MPSSIRHVDNLHEISIFSPFTVHWPLIYNQTYAESDIDPVHDNLVTFSSSSTSDIRLSQDGLPCQGILQSVGQALTAPSCARKIAEQLGQGDTVNLLDSNLKIIGKVAVFNQDETRQGILSVTLGSSTTSNRVFPSTAYKASSNHSVKAHYLHHGK